MVPSEFAHNRLRRPRHLIGIYTFYGNWSIRTFRRQRFRNLSAKQAGGGEEVVEKRGHRGRDQRVLGRRGGKRGGPHNVQDKGTVVNKLSFRM